jgi:hypothetical protein
MRRGLTDVNTGRRKRSEGEVLISRFQAKPLALAGYTGDTLHRETTRTYEPKLAAAVD